MPRSSYSTIRLAAPSLVLPFLSSFSAVRAEMRTESWTPDQAVYNVGFRVLCRPKRVAGE